MCSTNEGIISTLEKMIEDIKSGEWEPVGVSTSYNANTGGFIVIGCATQPPRGIIEVEFSLTMRKK